MENKKDDVMEILKLDVLLKDFNEKQLEIEKKDEVQKKYFDLSKVKPVGKNPKLACKIVMKKILDKKDSFKNPSFVIQVNQLLTNTKLIWINNKGDKFNDNNLFTLNVIARCLLTIGLENNLYLQLIATKRQNSFNIQVLPNIKTKKDFMKYYGIKDEVKEKKSKKDTTEKKENIENEKASVEENNEDIASEDLNSILEENKNLKLKLQAIKERIDGEGTASVKLSDIKKLLNTK